MAWTVDDKKGLKNWHLNGQRQLEAKYEDWKQRITANNLSPRAAADQMGDVNFEELSGQCIGQYTIRLSGEHRVAFTIDAQNQIVSVFQIGGHYPKTKK